MSSYAGVQAPPPAQGDDALRKTAASQIDLEISQGVAPIQSQITTTKNQEGRALGQVGGMFDALQPVVDKAAQGVQTAYDQATSQQQQIYSMAQARLQQIRGNRAGDAQALAQQIGGPVAINEFTQPFDDAATDLTYLGAGQELHTLAYAQAGVQEAQQFSGGVFPLVRTEQMASVRNQFEDQIREYQDQITAIKSQRGAQVNKRFNELRTQELQYGLQRAQFQLDKLDKKKAYDLAVQKAKTDKAAADRTYKLDKQQLGLDITKAGHDYEIALRTAGNDDKRIKLAEKQLSLDVAQITGKYGGKKTLDAIKEDNRAHEAMVAAGLNEKEINARIAEMSANRKIQETKLRVDQQTEWYDLLESAVNPQPGKTITHSFEVPATPMDQINNPNVYAKRDPKTGALSYWKVVTTTETQQPMEKITDPTKLVDWLVSSVNDPKQMSRQRAVDLVKARFPSLRDDWKYGEPATVTERHPAGTRPGAGKGKGAGKTQGAAAGSAGEGEHKSFTTPDPKKTYYTPGGPMKIHDAILIATGQVEVTDAAKKNMQEWFFQQGFHLPSSTTFTPYDSSKSKGNEKAKPPEWAGYKVPTTNTGKFDLRAIRAQARGGNEKAQAWLSGHGWST